MSQNPVDSAFADWRHQLPVLRSRVVLREPTRDDVAPVIEVLAACEAGRFGADHPLSETTVGALVERWAANRFSGSLVTYLITLDATVVGLIQLRQMDARFQAAEWEIGLVPSQRGTGTFLDAARLVVAFAFQTLGTHRLEARVAAQNGRAMGALRKLGAVQEGLLRRAIKHGDQYSDQALWALLSDDWGGR